MNLATNVSQVATGESHLFRNLSYFEIIHSLFPRNTELVSLWIMYDNLYRQSISQRKNPISVGRTLIKAELLNHRITFFQALLQEKEDLNFEVVFVHLESLIVFLLDLKPLEIPPGIFLLQITPKLEIENILVPSNEAGTSCFCDVVLVAMFLATEKYDVILQKKNMFTFFWTENFLKGATNVIPWIKLIQSDIETSACFKRQKTKEKTLQTANDIRWHLKNKIVLPMRNYTKESVYSEKSQEIGESITVFRLTLATECGRGDESLGQDDASELFRTILEVGGWQPVFLAITRKTIINTFSDLLNREGVFDNVPPIVRTSINAPDLPKLSLQTGFKEGESIQELFDLHFLQPQKQSENFLLKPGVSNVYETYIHTKDPTMYETYLISFQKTGFSVATVETTEFLRTPYILTFAIQRGVPGVLIEGHRIYTSVVITEGEIILVPFLHHSKNQPNFTEYRILAMACHIGGSTGAGHYVLYFRYNEGDQWFFYDDGKAEISPVNIHETSKNITQFGNTSHKTFIEQNAYLFWANQL